MKNSVGVKPQDLGVHGNGPASTSLSSRGGFVEKLSGDYNTNTMVLNFVGISPMYLLPLSVGLHIIPTY
jgi:hypothetical protein